MDFCVSAKSKNKEEATELVSYLCTDDAGQKKLSGIDGGQSIQLPNMKSLAEGEFMTAIEDGTLAFPSNVNVFFNYLQGTDKYEGRFQETTLLLPNVNGMTFSLKDLIMLRTAL